METKLLWIIPGEGFNLENGEPITYDVDLIKKKTHIDYCKEFCKSIGLNNIDYNSHEDYGRFLSSLGMIVVFNSGRPMDGKYFCDIYLPEQMSEKQILFLEDCQTLFKEKYYEEITFFRVKVYTSFPESFSYRIVNQCRDLKIENIISNCQIDNGQELLYREVMMQKGALSKNIR